ncbi:cyclin-G2 isoform X1 [Scophthalmus maximus]|uniref:cyclin-G2 isoform X1 n=1 Tax=Scophthalmus maximus TaxID=52904 RepID=UPI001FA93255|nr:cyclin-G2 isoform X1 [Scophthalmus maximus]XP_047185232.1 cyclin-G2 isoform X1 [Scophthalmus maximus]
MRDLQAIDSLLLKELKSCCAKEYNFLPREAGLKLMESASTQNHNGVSAKCRDARVEELWGLTSFFGYSTQTFVQAVNLLDRFLTIMKAQPKHLPCIGVCCLHMASKMVEAESNVSPTHELIRISQSKFTVSDLCRMEKIISDKLSVEPKAVTALTFLHLYHSAFASLSAGREEIPSIGRLEAQLKACFCRLVFSKAKVRIVPGRQFLSIAAFMLSHGTHLSVVCLISQPSVLALSLIAHELPDALQSPAMLKIVQQFQRHLKISDSELLHWKELVAKCMTKYHSSECNKPDNKKLVWIVSRRTAQNLQANHFSVPGLPTIPEGSWDESESEDSCEDMSCGEDSPCGSLRSDGEGAFFPSVFLKCGK